MQYTDTKLPCLIPKSFGYRRRYPLHGRTTHSGTAPRFSKELDMTEQKSCCVLVVDDEPIITELVADVLRSADIQVLTAQSGEEALDIVSREPIDVVLTDIRMDGMSGFDLLSKVVEFDSTIKVILMTAHDSYDMVKQAIQAGAYDYLVKPIHDHEQIISLIGRAHESVCLQRENAELIQRLRTSNLKKTAANRRLMQLNKQLRRLAITDGLTQLYNRRYIDDWLQNYAISNSGFEFSYSVVLMDVDHFKNVNDNYGHDGGDEVLRQLSTVLTNTARENDIVGRYGGEEFIVVLPGTSMRNACVCAERMREIIENVRVRVESQSLGITVSMGIASYSNTLQSQSGDIQNPYLSGRALITQADKALYLAKDRGRNRCLHYDDIIEEQPGQQLAG